MISNITDIKLGVTYSKAGSRFSLWSPSARAVSLMLYEDAGVYNEAGVAADHKDGTEYPMERDEDGVWTARIEGETAGLFYMYKVFHENGECRYAVDPYATAVSANGCRGAVVDPEVCNPEGWEQDKRPPFVQPADAVLYELHVRDFSISPDSGMKYKGKFKAFTETGLKDAHGNRLGIDHLAELGVTHVHLLPIFDFKTVNELKSMPFYEPEGEYNWGYDPQHYNVPEGSYATDPTRPEVRIRECKEMIQALHQKGMRVIMDVVYNHTYTVDDGPFEPVVPGYFYRKNADGGLSNGSGVGNELATEKPMVRKFIKDSLRYWAEEYHVDGFRFDLMALIDTATLCEIVEELRREVDPGILVYGEPWTGGESPLRDKTVKGSQRGKRFAVFNDHFRQAIKGDNDGGGRGFATGEAWCEGAIAEGMMGSIHDFAYEASETVNYVTVHDNLNLWDKVLASQNKWEESGLIHMNDGRPADGSSLQEKLAASNPYASVSVMDVMASDPVRRCLLANGIVLLSQGIPLIHAGDELLRTKFGDHNSYRSGDGINAMRWSCKERFLPVYDYYRGLIALRRKHPAFRMSCREQIEKHMEIIRCSDQIVAYRLKDHAGGDAWKQIVVIVNGNPKALDVELPATPYSWNIVADERRAGVETLSQVDESSVSVPGLSIMVLYEDERRPKKHKVKVEVEYERQDGCYEGWNLWVWGTGVEDGRIDFMEEDHGRVKAVFLCGFRGEADWMFSPAERLGSERMGE
ncbi:type I pullulanase [Paenibacillus sp. DMB20]|uniref:type I pullulanase n=1 Tax=Paenibacillus sp. DMB20 TaxID=1642570 RepID=UPI000AB7B28A|nr:type I pullulanase [Paenibacillus sp. DMB20]